MAVDIERLRSVRLSRTQAITPRDCMLYALGVGLGSDPLDAGQLRYVYEDRLQAVPSMAITLAYPELLEAYRQVGIDVYRILHGEQQFRLLRPLPTDFTVTGETRVVRIDDKGPRKGLLVYYETALRDAKSGELMGTLTSSSFCRADGGQGLAANAEPPPIERHALPSAPPTAVCSMPTLLQQALLYRLSGDYNALHADPSIAASAGHSRPILHGRCTFGMATVAILRTCCEYDAARLTAMTVRFTSPVYPGETLDTEIWQASGGAHFRTRVRERDQVVLDNGWAAIAG